VEDHEWAAMPNEASACIITASNLFDVWRETLRKVKQGIECLDPWESTRIRELPNSTIICERQPLRSELPEILRPALDQKGGFKFLDAFFNIGSVWPPAHNFNSKDVPRDNGEVTQYESVISHLRSKPTSRRGVIVLVNAQKDFPGIDLPPSNPKSHQHYEFPALVAVDFKIRSKLYLTAFFRSLEVLNWLPFNFIQLAAIQGNACTKLNQSPGPITILATSIHYYVEEEKTVEKILKMKPSLL